MGWGGQSNKLKDFLRKLYDVLRLLKILPEIIRFNAFDLLRHDCICIQGLNRVADFVAMGTRDSAYISAGELNAFQASAVYGGKFNNQEDRYRDGSADIRLFFLDTLAVQLLMILTRVLLSVSLRLWYCNCNSPGSHKKEWCFCLSRTTLCTLGLILQVSAAQLSPLLVRFMAPVVYLYLRKESEAVKIHIVT